MRFRLRRGKKTNRIESSLFDAEYYAQNLARRGISSELMSRNELLQHYLTVGFRKLIDPHPLFQIEYYYSQVPELRDGEQEPTLHFLSEGADRDISPCRLFDMRFYRCQLPEAERYTINPLLHFLRHGATQFLNPHPLFDTRYYDKKDPTIRKSQINPLVHFRKKIFDHPGHDPNPLFDCRYYLNRYRECQELRIDPLTHFIEYGLHHGNYVSRRHEEAMTRATNAQEMRLRRGRSTSGRALITCHDATRSGAPLIILRIIQELHDKYNLDCVVFLNKGGALKEEFRKVATIFDLDELGLTGELNESAVRMLVFSMFRGVAFGICNSAETSNLMKTFHYLRVPFISLIHEFPDWYPDGLFKEIHDQARVVVYPAKAVLESAEHAIGKSCENAVVLPQGVLSPTFPIGDRDKERRNVRSELGLSQDTFLALGCGEVTIRKGCDLFLSIAAMVRRKRPDGQIAFLWVGNRTAAGTGRHDRAARFWLEGDLERAGLEKTVFFVGEREKPDRYFLAADTFILSSRLDPFPCVVLEAMAAGLPVICFNRGTGAADLICNREQLAVPYLDIDKVCGKIIELHENKDFRRETGNANRSKVKNEYDFSVYVSSILQICKKYDLVNHTTSAKKMSPSACKKKIILLCSNLTPSNACVGLEVIGKQLDQLGWSVEVVAAAAASFGNERMARVEETNLGLPLRWVESSENSIEGLWETFISEIENNSPCIVLATDDYFSSAVTSALSDRVGVVGWVQSDDIHCYEQTYRLGRYWNAIVCAAEVHAQQVRDLNPGFSEKVYVIPNSTVKQTEIRWRRLSKELNHIGLVYCGPIDQEENRVLELKDLVENLEARNVSYRLTLIGEDPSGSTLWRLRAAWFRQIVNGTIRILGTLSRDDLFRELRANDVFVLLSGCRDVPVPLIESMAAGCIPMVIKNGGAICELVNDSINGYVVPGRNYEDWAATIERLWKDTSLRVDLAREAQHTIVKEFTIEKSAEKLDEIFRRIFNEISSGEYKRPPVLQTDSRYGDVIPPPEIVRAEWPGRR